MVKIEIVDSVIEYEYLFSHSILKKQCKSIVLTLDNAGDYVLTDSSETSVKLISKSISGDSKVIYITGDIPVSIKQFHFKQFKVSGILS
ncbi:MAG: hypothetical protein LBL76_04500 [Treponema sp.]|jgi:hypothetical protein|nr:hypothetical protein [Treponema sp.]